MSDDEAALDASILRIFICTDNHLGAYERDPVRADDSFAAFEEILRLAKKSEADFVLQGGDLYHEATPSRNCVQRTTELLSEYCLGDEDVDFEVISDAAANLRNAAGLPNYLHPHLSVGLPIFMVHGNHDAPAREGRFDPLGALDHLAAANLVNYFGTSDRVDEVEISPVLIRKGLTRVAIYGLGWMRDERLNRMWQQKKVTFLRPTEEDGRDSFFNIFVVHQNRDLGRGKKNCVHESMIPSFMDVVIWGHEHECQPQMEPSVSGSFQILQLGSSVATSLTAGEAMPKHVACIDVRGEEWRMQPIPLLQVRPLAYREICLRQIEELDPSSSKIEEDIAKYLEKELRGMIDEAAEVDARDLDGDAYDPEERRAGYRFKIADRHKPLLRLKVEHGGFPAIRVTNLAARFLDSVANPADMILLSRRKSTAAADAAVASTAAAVVTPGNGYRSIFDDADGETSEVVNINRMVEEQLRSAGGMKLLVDKYLTRALEDFVETRNSHAIDDMVDKLLHKTQRRLTSDANGPQTTSRDAIAAAVAGVSEQLSRQAETELTQRKAESSKPLPQGAGSADADTGKDLPSQLSMGGAGETKESSAAGALSSDEEDYQRRKRQRRTTGPADPDAEGDDPMDMGRRITELMRKKAPELKEMAGKLGLKKSGTKNEVATRIAEKESGGRRGGGRTSMASPKPRSTSGMARSRASYESEDDVEDDESPEESGRYSTQQSVATTGASFRPAPRRKRARVSYRDADDESVEEVDLVDVEEETAARPEESASVDDDDDEADEVQEVRMRSREKPRNRARVLEDSQPAHSQSASQSARSGRTMPSFFKRRGAKPATQTRENSTDDLASAFQ